jgi:hypothetical protein
MKKFILLLIVPLLFLNSCEEEDNTAEDDTTSCNCGVVTDLITIGGEAVPDGSGGVIIVGAHDSYSWYVVQNNCSGNISPTCAANLQIGQIYCMDYICVYSECVTLIDTNVVEAYMLTNCMGSNCDCEPIPFN